MDLDLESHTLRINQIRTGVDYKVVTLSPKTEKGARTMSLDGTTTAALRAHRVRQMEEKQVFRAGYESGGYVFRREDGKPIHQERFSSWFSQHCRSADLPPVSLPRHSVFVCDCPPETRRPPEGRQPMDRPRVADDHP